MGKRWYWTGRHGYIKFGLNTYTDYWTNLCTLLERELADFNSRVEREAATMEEDEKYRFYDSISESHWNLSKKFPEILRNTFFISCFSFLETELNDLCKKSFSGFKKKWGKDANRNPKPITVIYKECFENVLSPGFPTQSWNDIIFYNLIRNILVHNEGILKKSNMHYQEIMAFMEKNDLTNDLTLDEDKRILLTNHFINGVLDVMESFFDNIFDSIQQKEKTCR